MVGRWTLVLVLLCVVAGATLAAAGKGGINAEPTGLRRSACTPCHEAGGSNGPALQEMYLIQAVDTVVPVGGTVAFEVAVQNAWVAQLIDTIGVLNVTGAPGLGFSSGKDPVTRTIEGTVAPPATEHPANRRIDYVPLDIESGATDLRITLVNTAAVPEAGADLDLWLWAPHRDTSRTPTFTVADAGIGEAEVFELHGAQAILDAGAGTWTAGIVAQGAGSRTEVPIVAQTYTLRADQRFEVTADPIQVQGDASAVPSRETAPDARAHLTWILGLDQAPTVPGTLELTVDSTAHYTHSASYEDYWRFTKSITLQVTPLPEEGAVRISSVAQKPPELVSGFAWDRVGEVIGYASGLLIIASIATGGMFGKASRRGLNRVFGTAKRRVAFHNFVSYGIVAASVGHTVLFVFVEQTFGWTRGILWGGVAILAMFGLGFTGALQVPMIRRWNYGTWKWSHFGLSVGTIAFTVVHMLLDGQNFGDVQTAIGWSDPFG